MTAPIDLEAARERKGRRGPPKEVPTSSPGDGPPAFATALTDLGNAERFARDHGKDLRFCKDLGGWYVWTGTHWELDRTLESMRRAQRTARSLYDEAAGLAAKLRGRPTPHDDPKVLQQLLEDTVKHARATEERKRIGAILELGRAINEIPIKSEAFDRDPYALSVRNATIDLRTGEAREHRREDLITKCGPAEWRPDADAPLFTAFIERILPDPEVRAFVQRWAGYAATGVIREHILPVWVGDGGNGKSTLADLLQAVLGGYAIPMPENFLAEKKHEKHDTEIAQLFGTRLAVASETKAGVYLDESKVKRLTGGDRLAGRFMRGDYFYFDPTTKFVLFTNHKPRIKSTDQGIRRRVVLVPFTVSVPKAEQRETLKQEILERESSGVLRWVVEGARAWFARGEKLEAPLAVKLATEQYLASEDAFGRFLEEECELRPEDEYPVRSRIQPGELHKRFVEWCEANGERSFSLRAMTDQLGKLGRHAKKSNGVRWLNGIGFRGARVISSDSPPHVRGSSGHTDDVPLASLDGEQLDITDEWGAP